MTDLPLVDRPCVEIAAEPAAVWAALVAHFGGPAEQGAVAGAFVRAVGVRDPRPTGLFPEPGSTIRGFRVAASEPARRLLLEGRHRFSVYELEFRVRAEERGSELCAETRAAFPGVGALYRAAVIGSGAHRRLTGRMLRAVKERAEATPGGRA